MIIFKKPFLRPALLHGARAAAVLALLVAQTAQAQTFHSLDTGQEIGFVSFGVVLHGAAVVQSMGSHQHTLPLDASRVPGIDRIALTQWAPGAHKASNVLFGLTAAGSLALGFVNQHGQQPLLPAAITLESVLLTSGLTNVVKEWVGRPRPYAYNPDVPEHLRMEDKAYVSFWSGHTANTAALTFSTAAMVQRSDASPGLKTATWIGAATLPAAMGFLRVKAGRHFPTDVLTGYLIGAVVGVAVPYFHRSERSPLPH